MRLALIACSDDLPIGMGIRDRKQNQTAGQKPEARNHCFLLFRTGVAVNPSSLEGSECELTTNIPMGGNPGLTHEPRCANTSHWSDFISYHIIHWAFFPRTPWLSCRRCVSVLAHCSACKKLPNVAGAFCSHFSGSFQAFFVSERRQSADPRWRSCRATDTDGFAWAVARRQTN